MKKFGIIIISAFIFLACNDKKAKEPTMAADKTGKEKVVAGKGDPASRAEEMQKIKEDLEKMTPLSSDELTALVPGELMNTPRTKVDIDNAMGTLVANAEYKINDSVELKLEIVDCAGSGGAGLYGMQYVNMIDVNSDDDDEYVKTIDWKGGKAFENCKKARNRCTFSYFSANRFLVSLRGDNVGIDALKEIAGGISIK